MNVIEHVQKDFSTFLEQQLDVDAQTAQQCPLVLNVDEKKQDFGDLNTNAALVLAQKLGKKPRDIATQIADQFKHEAILRSEVAGPGFINFFLTDAALAQLAGQVFAQKNAFFKSEKNNNRSVSIEFVSANPTGPLHFGHGRGGIIGDVLGNVLTFLGHHVTKEFYINDAGAQITKLGNSFKIRCEQALGHESVLPDDAYHGEYLLELAKELVAERGPSVLNEPDSFFAQYAKEKMLARIKQTLDDYGIHFDVWFSEKTLHESGAIERAIKALEKAGYVYEKDGALWFESTKFGDDKDRVIRKASGELTYVAADIAYMQDKIARNHRELIFVLGHDHHSYVTRLQGLLKALGLADNNKLDVILYQLVKIKESGQHVRMSKRAGRIVSLADIIEEVGKDAARFFYLNRKADAQLDFDLDLALSKTDENPVYYIQYAYVRTRSILQKTEGQDVLQNLTEADAHLLGPDEALIIKKMAALKPLLEDIGSGLQTHLLAYYAHELAQAFNRYYNKHRVIELDNIPLSRARLLLVTALKQTFETVFGLLGISCPERM